MVPGTSVLGTIFIYARFACCAQVSFGQRTFTGLSHSTRVAHRCFSFQPSRLLFSYEANAAPGGTAVHTTINNDTVPSLRVTLRIPVALPSGGWSWGTYAPLGDILGEEFVFSAAEAHAVVHTYGRVIAMMLPSKEVERFSILAHGTITGHLVGMREWHWSPMRGAFEPVGEYLCAFRDAARELFRVTGHLIERMQFSPQVINRSAVSYAA